MANDSDAPDSLPRSPRAAAASGRAFDASPPLGTKLIDKVLRLWGRLQAVSMAFRLGSGEVAVVAAGAITVAFELFGNAGESFFDLLGSSPMFLAGFLACFAPFVRELAVLFAHVRQYRLQGSEAYRRDVLSRLELSIAYRDSGYVVRRYVDGSAVEWYVESDLVNRALLEMGPADGGGAAATAAAVDDVEIVVHRGRFVIPEEVRPIVLGVLSHMFRKNKGKRLTNGKLVGMCGDLLIAAHGENLDKRTAESPNEGDGAGADASDGAGASAGADAGAGETAAVTLNRSLAVQKTRYFDGQCTNEIVFKRAPKATSLRECFLGEDLLLENGRVLYEFWQSRCANFIGVSTIAITADGCLIIGRQGSGSMANASRLAPSGSGSVEFSDVRHVRANGRLTLRNLLAYAAERELREECGLREDAVMTTRVIGYARLIERGGKPDFFCITELADLTSSQVRECFDCQLSLQERDALSADLHFERIGDASRAAVLNRYLDGVRANAPGEHLVSIQLSILAENLELLELADGTAAQPAAVGSPVSWKTRVDCR